MQVKLVSVTKPEIEGIGNAEGLMVYTARVSNPNNQLNMATGSKLLKYCLDNGHFSIFEMVDMTVEIECSRAMSAQITRHKSFSFQEFSQRYSKVTGFEVYEARSQDSKNRQNSLDNMSEEEKDWFEDAQLRVIQTCKDLYDSALERGIARELARMLLPVSSKTRLYMKGSVRSWIHYLQLRLGNGTQAEHQEIAKEIQKIFIQQFPAIAESLNWG